MDIEKKPYELSVWKDKQWYLMQEDAVGDPHYIIDTTIHNGYIVINDYLKEEKLGVIGADTMEAPIRAFNVQFTENVNGNHELTFDMYFKYWDYETDSLKDNPWNTLLTNEQKIKLSYDGKVYDFIIKKITEDSQKYIFSYNCTDLFIEELSKNGYSIEMNTDLMNNMGTANELATNILKGTEWSVGSDSEIIKEKVSELLFDYEVPIAGNAITMKVLDAFTYNGHSYTKGSTLTANPGNHIYIFYSSVVNNENRYQVLFSDFNEYVLDSNSTIISAPNCVLDNALSVSDPIISKVRGKKLVQSYKTKYIDILKETCTEYTYNNVDYYCVNGIQFASADQLTELISNNISFTTTDGWYKDADPGASTIDISRESIGSGYKNVLSVTFGSGSKNWIGNHGFNNLRANLTNGLIKGETYILLFDLLGNNNITSAVLSIKKDVDTTINYTFGTDGTVQGYYKYKADIDTSLSYEDLINALDITLKIYGTASSSIKIVESKLFKKETINGTLVIPDLTSVEDYAIQYTYKMFRQDKLATLKSADALVYDTIFIDTIDSGWVQKKEDNYAKVSSINAEKSNRFNLIQNIAEQFQCWAKFDIQHNGQVIDYYYDLTHDDRYYSGKRYYKRINEPDSSSIDRNNANYKVRRDIDFTARQDEFLLGSYFISVSGTTYDSSRKYYYKETDPSLVVDFYYVSLTSEEYAAITDKTNYYYLDTVKWTAQTAGDTDYRVYEKYYKKYITFHEYIGQDNPVGFKYGINLNGIKRDLNTDAITTKLIVQQNNNQYSSTGIGLCSIALSKYNPTKENFILNFDYYIHQNILDEDTLLRDLYNTTNTNGIGYISKLGKLNVNNDELITTQGQLSISRINANANYQKNLQTYIAAQTETDNYKNYLDSNGITKSGDYYEYDQSDTSEVRKWKTNYNTNYVALKNAETAKIYYAGRLTQYDTELAKIARELQTITNAKEGLNETFNSKYSRYIREGSWIDESYTEPDKYYIDAQNVAYNSAYPQVSYTISVADVSMVEGYQLYTFAIADETYVEDVEFFGKQSNGKPYQEKVVVTQIVNNLDNPSKNTITVKNYDNKWDSLFQRITATSDSVQFHEGEYQRAADTVASDGTIKGESFNQSLKNSSALAETLSDEITKGDAIQLVHYNYPEKKIRIGASGITITNSSNVQGDPVWTTAISADGINASEITTGQLNTDKILIYAGKDASFVWNKDNLTAYAHEGTLVATNKYVRFNQTGIQGFDNSQTPTFSLTYNGFALNAINSSNYVKINNNGPKSSSPWAAKSDLEKVIRAGSVSSSVETDKFVVYADGSVYAKDGYFEGTVEAIEGKFGGVEIGNNQMVIYGSRNHQPTDAHITITPTSIDFGGSIPQIDIDDQMEIKYNITHTTLGQSIIEAPVINAGYLSAPEIEGNLIKAVGNEAGFSGTFAIYKAKEGSETQDTLRGYLGYATGASSSGATNGIAMSTYKGENAQKICLAPYVIVTDAGARMSYGDFSEIIPATDPPSFTHTKESNIFVTKEMATIAHEHTVNGTIVNSQIYIDDSGIYYQVDGGTPQSLGTALFG